MLPLKKKHEASKTPTNMSIPLTKKNSSCQAPEDFIEMSKRTETLSKLKTFQKSVAFAFIPIFGLDNFLNIKKDVYKSH